MSFPLDLASFSLYILQQIGVIVAVGAQVVLLVAYLAAVHDKTISYGEERFARVGTTILRWGLALIILSGIGAVLFHLFLGQVEVLMSPAFLFKWVLLGILLFVTIVQGRAPFSTYVGEGFAGANWIALFVVHTVAPITSWGVLSVCYALGLATFLALWSVIVYVLEPKEKRETPKPAATVVTQIPHIVVEPPVQKPPPPPPPPKPTPPPPPPPPRIVPHITIPAAASTDLHNEALPKKAALPEVLLNRVTFPPPHKPPMAAPRGLHDAASRVPIKPSVPAMAVPRKPVFPSSPVPMKVPQKPGVAVKDAHGADGTLDLPAIWVMPRTPQEIDSSKRASTVQFTQE